MNGDESGRERILHVARALFIERGFADVSMQQIADAAGLRKASIYHHFRSKNELFAAIAILELEELHERTKEAIAASDDLTTQLAGVARAWFTQVREESGRLMRDFQEQVPEADHEAVHTKLDAFVTTITGAFERAIAAGQICEIDSRVAAFLFFDMVSGWAVRAMFDHSLIPPDPNVAVETVTQVFLYGLATPEFRREHELNNRACVPA